MWAARYFTPRYWAARFWAKVGATGVYVPAPDCVYRVRALSRTHSVVALSRIYRVPWPAPVAVHFDGAFDPDSFDDAFLDEMEGTMPQTRVYTPKAGAS